MKKSKYLLSASLALCLCASAFADPPKSEDGPPKEEQSKSLEFQIPEKIITQTEETGTVDEKTREKGSGMATGKRTYEPVSAGGTEPETQEMNKKEMAEKLAKKADISKDAESGETLGNELTHTIQQGGDTRDAASGLATGKRQHKPLTITKEMDKATPDSEPEMVLTFDEALAACRNEIDLQACVDKKSGQTRIRELDKSSVK